MWIFAPDPLPSARNILGVTLTNDGYFNRKGKHTHSPNLSHEEKTQSHLSRRQDNTALSFSPLKCIRWMCERARVMWALCYTTFISWSKNKCRWNWSRKKEKKKICIRKFSVKANICYSRIFWSLCLLLLSTMVWYGSSLQTAVLINVIFLIPEFIHSLPSRAVLKQSKLFLSACHLLKNDKCLTWGGDDVTPN